MPSPFEFFRRILRLLGATFLCLALTISQAPATVGTTSSSVTAQGNGVTTAFNYAFIMPSASYAVVQITDTTVTPTVVTTLSPTQYSITGINNSSGGTVTYPLSGSPLASGKYITISRVVPLIQTTSLCSQGPTFCAIEHALDYLTYIAQQLQTEISAILIQIGLSPVIGPPSGTTYVTNIANLRLNTSALFSSTSVQGYYTQGDGGGDIFNYVPTDTSSSDNGCSVIVDGIGHRWWRALNGKSLTVKQCGARCDGVSDDTTALQNAETVAQSVGSSLLFPSGGLCKTTSDLTAGAGVVHKCLLGMNADSGGSFTSGSCGVDAQVGSGHYAWKLQNANGTVGVKSPEWYDMYITSTGGGIQLNSIAGGFTDDNTTQAAMLYPVIRNVTISTNEIAVQCSKCFYGQFLGGQWNGNTTTLDLEGSDLMTVGDGLAFLGNTTLDINIQAHSTFGNGDVIRATQIECPFTGGTACVVDNGRSSHLHDLVFECQGTLMNQAILVGDASAPKNLAFWIENNYIGCNSTFATNWLVVKNTTPPLLSVVTDNSDGGGGLGSSLWNNGSGVLQYVNATHVAQIFHHGNGSEGGFPFSSLNNLPEAWGQQTPGLLISWTPGSTSYTVDHTNYGASVMVVGGAWQLPATSKELDFDVVPTSYTGTLDICMLSSGSTAITLTGLDNGSSTGTATPGSTALQWTCVSNMAYATAATAKITSAGSGATGNIFEVIIRQHGI